MFATAGCSKAVATDNPAAESNDNDYMEDNGDYYEEYDETEEYPDGYGDENFEDYYIEFNKDRLEKLVLSDACFYTVETEKFPLKDGKLPLRHDMFDNDALFFTATSGEVLLKSDKNANGIKIVFKDMTCLGLWKAAKVDAPYVCIEPWHGVPSDDGKVDDLSTKRQTIKLKPSEIFTNSYMIEVMEN